MNFIVNESNEVYGREWESNDHAKYHRKTGSYIWTSRKHEILLGCRSVKAQEWHMHNDVRWRLSAVNHGCYAIKKTLSSQLPYENTQKRCLYLFSTHSGNAILRIWQLNGMRQSKKSFEWRVVYVLFCNTEIEYCKRKMWNLDFKKSLNYRNIYPKVHCIKNNGINREYTARTTESLMNKSSREGLISGT